MWPKQAGISSFYATSRKRKLPIASDIRLDSGFVSGPGFFWHFPVFLAESWFFLRTYLSPEDPACQLKPQEDKLVMVKILIHEEPVHGDHNSFSLAIRVDTYILPTTIDRYIAKKFPHSETEHKQAVSSICSTIPGSSHHMHPDAWLCNVIELSRA